jgi:hypothetical protein
MQIFAHRRKSRLRTSVACFSEKDATIFTNVLKVAQQSALTGFSSFWQTVLFVLLGKQIIAHVPSGSRFQTQFPQTQYPIVPIINNYSSSLTLKKERRREDINLEYGIWVCWFGLVWEMEGVQV